MAEKPRIRLVKRGERDRRQQAAEERGARGGGDRDPSREALATVTGWVREYQQKRRAHSARAFRDMFEGLVPHSGKS